MNRSNLLRDIDLLIELFESPDSWTQHGMAKKNNHGHLVDSGPNEPESVCWCLLGGCLKISEGNYSKGYFSTITRTLAKIIDPSINKDSSEYDWDCCTAIHKWNDDFVRTWDDLQRLLLKAKDVIQNYD